MTRPELLEQLAPKAARVGEFRGMSGTPWRVQRERNLMKTGPPSRTPRV